MPTSVPRNGKTVVVALGGNAILQPGQIGSFEEQLFNVDGAMRRIVALVEDGWATVTPLVGVRENLTDAGAAALAAALATHVG